MTHFISTRVEQPTNLIDLLQSNQPIDPRVLRSHYPAWLDVDIRHQLEQVLLDPSVSAGSKSQQQQQHPSKQQQQATPASIVYQEMLDDMMREVKSKQKEIQQKRNHTTTKQQSEPAATNQPPPSTSPTRTSSAAPRSSLSYTSPSSSKKTTTNPRSSPKSAMRPTSAASAAAPRSSKRTVSTNSNSNSSTTSNSTVEPPLSPQPHATPHPTPLSPRSVSTAQTINVSLTWLNEVEQKLVTLATAIRSGELQNPQHQFSNGDDIDSEKHKAAELQRVKYAMLITKLEEMNRLHREVLSDDQQKQHYESLAQLQLQTQREFQSRLDGAHAEIRRLKEEREKERTVLHQQREQDRLMLIKSMSEKDLSIEQLRTHFIEREKLLIESHKTLEDTYSKQKASQHDAEIRNMDERAAERAQHEKVRQEQQSQLSALMSQLTLTQEQLNKRTLEYDAMQHEMMLVKDENMRMKNRQGDNSDRLAMIDTMQSTIHRLQYEASERADLLQAREKYWKEQTEEMEHREARLQRMRVELDEREASRRDARRRERRDGATYADGAIYGIHKGVPNDFDCAWASGPIDRNQLVRPMQSYR